MAKNISEVTREVWQRECFPEWGKWLVEEIDMTKVEPGTFAMWWMGCTGIWIKSEGNANISIDLFSGNAKTTHFKWDANAQGPNYQMGRMMGTKQPHPNPRNVHHVMDPFEITAIDAFVATHDHGDHMDIYSTAAVANRFPGIPFIGPVYSTNKWRGWGVPEKQLVTVKPGDVVKVKDIEIHVVDSFDRTALITSPPEGSIVGRLPDDMDERAVNYIVKTPGGSVYHSGDSHFSNYYVRHGKQHTIDVALASFAENPIGMTDKMTSSDVLRMAENLNCKVMIPIHWDIWSTFKCDPKEVLYLYEIRKARMQYKFKPFIWQVGGKFVYPDDKDVMEYMYPRGFSDAFEEEPNIPFKSFL